MMEIGPSSSVDPVASVPSKENSSDSSWHSHSPSSLKVAKQVSLSDYFTNRARKKKKMNLRKRMKRQQTRRKGDVPQKEEESLKR
jgi:hypothetical protein